MLRRGLKKFLAGLMMILVAKGAQLCFEHGQIEKEEIRAKAAYVEELGKSLHRQLLGKTPGCLLPKSGMGIE